MVIVKKSMFSLLQPYGGVAGFFRKTMDDETGETDNAFGNGQDGGSYYRKSRLTKNPTPLSVWSVNPLSSANASPPPLSRCGQVDNQAADE